MDCSPRAKAKRCPPGSKRAISLPAANSLIPLAESANRLEWDAPREDSRCPYCARNSPRDRQFLKKFAANSIRGRAKFLPAHPHCLEKRCEQGHSVHFVCVVLSMRRRAPSLNSLCQCQNITPRTVSGPNMHTMVAKIRRHSTARLVTLPAIAKLPGQDAAPHLGIVASARGFVKLGFAVADFAFESCVR